MSNLNVTEYAGVARGSGQSVQIVQLPPITTQNVSFTATPGQSAAFNAKTTVIRVQADADCFLAVGADPTAATTDLPLTSGVAEYFSVIAGYKISVRSA